MVNEAAEEHDPRQKYAWYPLGWRIQSLQPMSLKLIYSSSLQHSFISGRQFEFLFGLFFCGNGDVCITRNGFNVCSTDTGAVSRSIEQVLQATCIAWFNRSSSTHFFSVNVTSVFTHPSETAIVLIVLTCDRFVWSRHASSLFSSLRLASTRLASPFHFAYSYSYRFDSTTSLFVRTIENVAVSASIDILSITNSIFRIFPFFSFFVLLFFFFFISFFNAIAILNA